MMFLPFQLVPQRVEAGKPRPIAGFTLVEMLVAMAITLVMMAALARSFSYVSANVQQSRANTELAASLRDMTTRLSDELAQCTVSLQPNLGGEDQLGYFVYYEGPTTDATSSLFRAADDPATGDVVLSDAKYGDFDDYIAFTAVAPGNSWFTGKVPRYILDMKTAQINGVAYTPGANAFEPVVIQSKYAEIIYFAAPEYPTFAVGMQASQLVDPDYIDVDGDLDLGSGSAIQNGLPDRMRIHRRVLLIRPDLNLDDGMLPIQNNGTVDFMLPDAWPTATSTGANPTVIDRMDAGQANLLSLGWLYGMAGVHQQCDLSIRRMTNAAGNPTQRVAANSLADLAKPHNRFAHVRVPSAVLTGGGSYLSSMPVLALGSAPTILDINTSASPVQIAPPDIPNVGPVVTPVSLCGFLRPEFILGYDYVHLDSTADVWGRERIGEDLLTNNALGFDVQVYDPQASFFRASNGVLVGPSDPGYREVVIQEIDPLSPTTTNPIDALMNRERGGFVDLCYPVLAGGSLRGWQPRRVDRRSNADDAGFNPILDPANAPTVNFLSTPFSGLLSFTSVAAATNARAVYDPFLSGSGKLVTNGTTIRLFQPTFDTYTSSYERDGFGQAPVSAGSDGAVWWPTSATTIPIDPGADGLDNDQMFGADDFGEREATPPFESRPEAIRVTIRIENPAVRLIRQASVEYRDRN